MARKNPWPTPAGVPRYRFLALVLRERIMSGQYPAGSQLPTLDQLMDESGYSRLTVRGAVGLLTDERLVRTVLGRGTFIRPRDEWKAGR